MANEPQEFEPEDPLVRFSVLSLFPRTFGVLQKAPQPYNLEQDLDSLHDRLKSSVFRSPQKLLDQAKAVIEVSSKQLNTDIPSNAASELNNEPDVTAMDNPKKRRPGLGLKRPRFSLKPESRQASVNLDPSFDVDIYEEPEEFFAAFERFERAEKEIQKQTGVGPKDNDNLNILKESRARRPGLLGRSYKSLFSGSEIFPQEAFGRGTIASLNFHSQEISTLPNLPSEEKDLTGSTKENNKLNELLNELLSKDFEDLDGDGAVNCLKEHLKIKTINIENLGLPDVQHIPVNDMTDLVGNSMKLRRPLSNIHNLMKGVDRTSPVKHSRTESSNGSLSSKTQRKSPFAHMTSLKKRLFNAKSPVTDPFSFANDNEVGMSSHTIHLDSQYEDVDLSNKGSIPGEVELAISKADENPATKMGPSEVTLLHSTNPHDDFVTSHSNQEDLGNDLGSSQSNDDMEHQVSSCFRDQAVRDEDVSILDAGLHIQAKQANSEPPSLEATRCNQLHPDMDNSNTEELVNNGDLLDSSICCAIKEPGKDGSLKSAGSAREEQVEEPMQISMKGESKEKSSTHRGQKRKPVPSGDCSKALSNPAVAVHHNAESVNDAFAELPEEVPTEMPNAKSKLEHPQKRLKNKRSRQSLADAGTKWEKDREEREVRRSTRIRSRPLAYWKGERFLYGRIHESLTTVIGVKKLESPETKGGERALRVTSFVDDKYKELVEFVALH